MTQSQNSDVNHEFDNTDPPEGLEIIELTANQNFTIRETVSWSTRGVGAFLMLVAIAFLMVPITQGSLLEDLLREKIGDTPPLVTQLVRTLLIIGVVLLLFQVMRLLFGITEVRGTASTISGCYKLFGIPVNRSMNQCEFRFVEVKYFRGRTNSSSDVESRFSGRWEVRMVGRNGVLKFYKTGSLEEAEWMSRFVSDWFNLEIEREGDDRKIGW